MFLKQLTDDARKAGMRQGVCATLIVASPFILAGIKWMAENRQPLAERMKRLQSTDMYAKIFDKKNYEQKKAERKLETFRSAEGNYNDYDVEASKEEDEALFTMIKEITKQELSGNTEKTEKKAKVKKSEGS